MLKKIWRNWKEDIQNDIYEHFKDIFNEMYKSKTIKNFLIEIKDNPETIGEKLIDAERESEEGNPRPGWSWQWLPSKILESHWINNVPCKENLNTVQETEQVPWQWPD